MIISNAGHLATRQLYRGRVRTALVKKAVAEGGRLIYNHARELSNYEYATIEQLREMGHPYAMRSLIRKPRGYKYHMPSKKTTLSYTPKTKIMYPKTMPKPPWFISRHTGAFYKGWRWNVLATGNIIVATVWNSSAHSRFMMGTKWMVPRKILDEAEKRSEGMRTELILLAVRGRYFYGS